MARKKRMTLIVDGVKKSVNVRWYSEKEIFSSVKIKALNEVDS